MISRMTTVLQRLKIEWIDQLQPEAMVTNLSELTSRYIVFAYQKRWAVEQINRDLKTDLGMGEHQVRQDKRRLEKAFGVAVLAYLFVIRVCRDDLRTGPSWSVANLPYLLKGIQITRPNHVWGTDITYIRLHGGFVYLVAFLDWYSRYIVSWKLSTTLETAFCLEAAKEALTIGIPEIVNSDQGVQNTGRVLL